MKKTLLPLFIYCFLATSCSSLPDADKQVYLNKGDTVKLNRSFPVPESYAHVNFQNGEIISDGSIQWYETSCVVDTDSLGPKTVPQNDYQVSEVSYDEDWYSNAGAVLRYYTEIHLKAASTEKNIVLTCQVLDDPMQHHSFPLSEIRQATGQYFTFSAKENQ